LESKVVDRLSLESCLETSSEVVSNSEQVEVDVVLAAPTTIDFDPTDVTRFT
jgi:hypothetical protein